jgi:hypothetical protein
MTKETLNQIVSDHWESAKRGDAFAISAIIGAQDELKKIAEFEKNLNMAKASQLANRAMAKIISNEVNWEKGIA